MTTYNTEYWNKGYWPDGFWPQGFWPANLVRIADWIAAALDSKTIEGTDLLIRIIRPVINDFAESQFNHADVFLCGIKEKIEVETTTPSRIDKALFRVYAVLRAVPISETADTMLNRISETIRKLLLAGNIGGAACDGLAMSIDCPYVKYLPGDGCQVAAVDVIVEYWIEN